MSRLVLTPGERKRILRERRFRNGLATDKAMTHLANAFRHVQAFRADKEAGRVWQALQRKEAFRREFRFATGVWYQG